MAVSGAAPQPNSGAVLDRTDEGQKVQRGGHRHAAAPATSRTSEKPRRETRARQFGNRRSKNGSGACATTPTEYRQRRSSPRSDVAHRPMHSTGGGPTPNGETTLLGLRSQHGAGAQRDPDHQADKNEASR